LLIINSTFQLLPAPPPPNLPPPYSKCSFFEQDKAITDNIKTVQTFVNATLGESTTELLIR